MRAILKQMRYNGSILLRTYCDNPHSKCTPCNPCHVDNPLGKKKCTPVEPAAPPNCVECGCCPPKCVPCVPCKCVPQCNPCPEECPPDESQCEHNFDEVKGPVKFKLQHTPYEDDEDLTRQRRLQCCCQPCPPPSGRCGGSSQRGRGRGIKKKMMKYTFFLAVMGAVTFTCFCKACQNKDE